ncbi:MAG: response regulator transcription factor [Flavobacteriales bacterium]|nr:response regulator transcription factor [Flavobacteriales bacterium]
MDSPIRTLLVDDQGIILEGLEALLEGDEAYAVVGLARSGEEAVRLAERRFPDVVVMDISMPPGFDGIEAMRRIKLKQPHIKVLMLSMYHMSDMVQEALQAGASGYLLKNTSRKQFKEALKTVMNGGSFLASEIMEDLKKAAEKEDDGDRSNGVILTRRERQILCMVAFERNTYQIAHELRLSHRTVETHRRNIMRKLRISNVAGLVKYVMDRGWHLDMS